MKRQEIRDNLPKRWRNTIQQLTGFTVTYISYVVLGNRPANTDAAKQIMDAAEKLAEKNIESKKEFKRKLSQL